MYYALFFLGTINITNPRGFFDCLPFSSEFLYHNLPFFSHVLPPNPSMHMHSPSSQVPLFLQTTSWHIFSLSRLISLVALTKRCLQLASSVFTSKNLLHSCSSLPRPEQGVPPHLCSFFSLVRNMVEVPHLSGQSDHSVHSPQVQGTAKFKRKS